MCTCSAVLMARPGHAAKRELMKLRGPVLLNPAFLVRSGLPDTIDCMRCTGTLTQCFPFAVGMTCFDCCGCAGSGQGGDARGLGRRWYHQAKCAHARSVLPCRGGVARGVDHTVARYRGACCKITSHAESLRHQGVVAAAAAATHRCSPAPSSQGALL